jgi:hypothetical protein
VRVIAAGGAVDDELARVAIRRAVALGEEVEAIEARHVDRSPAFDVTRDDQVLERRKRGDDRVWIFAVEAMQVEVAERGEPRTKQRLFVTVVLDLRRR